MLKELKTFSKWESPCEDFTLNLLKWIWSKESRSRIKRNTFNIMFAEQPQFLSSLFDWSHWRLTGVIDLPHFFRALLSLVPKGSILCLVGGAWPDRVQNILDTISFNMESTPLPPANLTLGFTEAYIIPITELNMAKLADVCEHSAEIEIAMHLSVLFDDERLLEWYDLPCDDPIAIAEMIDEESVSHFANSVEGKYQKITFCDNRKLIEV